MGLFNVFLDLSMMSFNSLLGNNMMRNFVLNIFFVLGFLIITGCNRGNEKKSDISTKVDQMNSIKFLDVTIESGLGDFLHANGAFGEKWFPEPMGGGGGFIDYDNDGWQDILLVRGGTWPGRSAKNIPVLALYKNNGDGTFSDKTLEAGLKEFSTYGLGIAVSDYDNDGDEDFLLTTLSENMFFRNDNSKFIEIGKESGIANGARLSTSAIFFDGDKDGWLDLYIGNYTRWSPETDIWCSFQGKKGYCTPNIYDGEASRFYKNNGDGTFSDRTKEAGFLPAPGKTLGVVEIDYNKDGWSDLAVANDLEHNLLYVNNKDGSFSERGLEAGIAVDETGSARAGMGIDAGPVDRNNEVSIFVGNFQDEMIGVFRHMGNGFFMDRAAISNIGRPSLQILTFGLFLFDVDLDMDLDLLALNGHIQIEIEQRQDGFQFRQLPHLYLNRGSGTFDLLKAYDSSTIGKPIVGRGAAYADYDKDGDLDVLVTENAGPVFLWRNELNQPNSKPARNYLRFKLLSNKGNRDAIGSEIGVKIDGKWNYRRVKAGSSYLSQSEKIITFGLSNSLDFDSVVVKWSNGEKEYYSNLPINEEGTVKQKK